LVYIKITSNDDVIGIVSYRNLLSVVDWDGIFRNDDIDIITNTITNTILDAAKKTIPNRYITVKKDNPPWITTKIKKYIRIKIEFIRLSPCLFFQKFYQNMIVLHLI
jgi:hypothetical protein